jgi:hypothetical protein
MEHTLRMIGLRPGTYPVPETDMAGFVTALADCALACRLCAQSCLEEPTVAELVGCVALNKDCATACDAALRAVLRWTPASDPRRDHALALVDTCALTCALCADECDRHADTQHCAVCARACRVCEHECLIIGAALHR